MKAYIALETGGVIEARGRSEGRARGEIVFTTAYTGYEESLTDPSYAEQILTFAYPLIGNYGVRKERFESDTVHPNAVLAGELTDDVVEWFDTEDTPALDHLDTREIVTTIRNQGAMRCGIAVGDGITEQDAINEMKQCKPISDQRSIGEQVSIGEEYVYGDGETTVALIDCGAKGSITTSLVERGSTVHVFPYDTDISTVENISPDVLFISNGPGDPENFNSARKLVENFVGKIPIAGICLGQQIVALALGGDTEKMDFGHRGVNQPVRDLEKERVIMTTQNHGYTVTDPGPHLEVTQVNVNDGTSEGLDGTTEPIITRQYHPEAHPGPHDSLDFFDSVLELPSKNKS